MGDERYGENTRDDLNEGKLVASALSSGYI
jgi:hypothetical protein